MLNENNKIFMGQKAASIVDANMRFVAPASLLLYSDGVDLTEELYDYELQDGEMVISHCAPVMRESVDGNGYIYPAWDGNGWVESATVEEIAAWEKEHPAQETEPSQFDQIEAQVTYTAMMTDTLLEV